MSSHVNWHYRETRNQKINKKIIQRDNEVTVCCSWGWMILQPLLLAFTPLITRLPEPDPYTTSPPAALALPLIIIITIPFRNGKHFPHSCIHFSQFCFSFKPWSLILLFICTPCRNCHIISKYYCCFPSLPHRLSLLQMKSISG